MIRRLTLAVLSVLAVAATAHADTTVTASVTAATQDGTSNKSKVGLLTSATTTMAKLHVGGGYSLTCEGSTTNPTAQRSLTVNKPFLQSSVTQQITTPASVPTTYPMAGFEEWVAGAAHQCTFTYKGIAAGTDAGATMTLSGGGASITFSGGAAEPAEDSQTAFFNMVKPYPTPPPPDPPCTPGFNCCYQ